MTSRLASVLKDLVKQSVCQQGTPFWMRGNPDDDDDDDDDEDDDDDDDND